MSDDEFMPSCDSADYDFGYSDEGSDQPMEDETDPENNYYNCKALVESEPQRAFDGFRQIVAEHNDTDIAVKANKQSIKLLIKCPEVGDMRRVISEFLDCIVSTNVNQSYREQSCLNMFDLMQTHPEFDHFLEAAMAKFKSTPGSGSERLAGRTTIKLATAAFNEGNYDKSINLIDQLGPIELNGTDQYKKTIYLEALALRIQIAMQRGSGEEERLFDMIKEGSDVQMAHPRILAVIRECGGVVAVKRRQWAEARELLLKAFKSYDEAGSSERMQILQHYIVCSILTESALNPFDSQETLAYKDSNQLNFLQRLVDSFSQADLTEFKAIMCEPYFESSALVKTYMVPSLLTSFQSRLLDKLLRPYSCVRFEFIASKLEISPDEVPLLITRQILANRLPRARLDDTSRVVYLRETPIRATRPLRANFQLPERYKEFAASSEREKFEKAILLAQENRQKEKNDLTSVFEELVIAVRKLHTDIAGAV